MDRKIWLGGGAAVLLSLGTLIGGVATGMVGAQSPRSAQTAPEAEGPDTPVSLPAGSVSQDAAKQAAVTYIQQTAPYSSQGLSPTKVSVDDENGTVVFKVGFSGANNQAAEVTVSPQGTVLKAEAGDGQERPGVDADGPGGHADELGAPGSQSGQ